VFSAPAPYPGTVGPFIFHRLLHKTRREFFVNLVIQRIFGTAIRSASAPRRSQKLTLDQLRQGPHSARWSTAAACLHTAFGHKINVCRTASNLWLLRSDFYQCILQEHSQGVAAESINRLIPAFEGRLPASQLNRI